MKMGGIFIIKTIKNSKFKKKIKIGNRRPPRRFRRAIDSRGGRRFSLSSGSSSALSGRKPFRSTKAVRLRSGRFHHNSQPWLSCDRGGRHAPYCGCSNNTADEETYKRYNKLRPFFLCSFTTPSVLAKMTHFLAGTRFYELLVNVFNWREKM